MNIPLEDNYNDILGKAQRGRKLSNEQLAEQAGVTVADVRRVVGGEFAEPIVRRLAPVLGLSAARLVAAGRKEWYPQPREVAGVALFNTPFQDMTVNAYLAWDPATKQAAAFDTGADAGPMLAAVRNHGLTVAGILITHIHGDHIADLERLKKETGATAYVSALEPVAGAVPFAPGRELRIGGLTVATRQTSGHSKGGTTYVVTGLARPVAVVGDALFAGSMGGGLVNFAEALRNNQQQILTLPNETVLCCGHGPLTTVGEEKQHNPFHPEFE